MNTETSDRAFKIVGRLVNKNPNLQQVDRDLAIQFFMEQFENIDQLLLKTKGWAEYFDIGEYTDYMFYYLGAEMVTEDHMGNMMDLIAAYYNAIYFRKKIHVSWCSNKDHVMVSRLDFAERSKPKNHFYSNNGSDNVPSTDVY